MRRDASILRGLADRALATAGTLSPSAARVAGGRLLRQHRFAEAETLLASAARSFPRHAGVRARHALAAEVDGRFAEAAERWREVCTLRPRSAAPWRGLAAALRMLGDIDAAAAAVAQAATLRPNEWRTLYETARIHDRAEQPADAVSIWTRLVARRPTDPLCRQGYADCLIRLDRLDEAAREIAAGLERHPDHRGLVAAQGLLAMRRQDWDHAFTVWSTYTATYPDDEIGRVYLSRVTSVRQLATAEALGRPPQMLAPVSVERVEDEEIRALMLRFEGIGTDCEFGTLQRRYGAEPLGLLRWNDVTFATLAAALEARFSGMGEPEATELVAGSIGELYVRDRRWDLGMHTFLFLREVSQETLFPKMCRRVAYLRDKFVADLEAAEKVLVYKSFDLAYVDLARLHDLLRGYGPLRLLHVRLATSAGIDPWPAGAAGTVTQIAPDLYVGYVTRMGNLYDIPADEWVAICRAMVEGSGARPDQETECEATIDAPHSAV